MFKIMDDDNSRQLSLYEFTKAMRDFKVGIAELFIVNSSVSALIIVLKYQLYIIFSRVRWQHNAQSLNGSFKLV